MANNSLTYTLLIICALILCTVTAIFVCKRISRNRPFLNTDTPPSVSDLRSTVCSLIENLPDGVIVLDKDSRISDINSAAVRLIGYDLLSENNPWNKLSEISGPSIFSKTLELEISNSGLTRYLEVRITPVPPDSGESAGQLIVLRDITDRKLTHQNLEALYQEERELRSNLQQEIANRSRYTRAFIHELKTPLTAILSSSELLESVVSDSTALAVIENVRQASLNMEYRINELLDLARADIGLLKITVVPLDIQDLIDETLLEFKPAAEAKNLRLEAAVTALPQVNGDRSKLKFVLSNLIANSLQNTTAGEIIVSAGCFEKDFITITVTDTGQGIDPLQLSVIFDPYRRKITEGQKYSGLGVGLALSKLYIELHHGSIQAESAVGKGSRFSFTLPLYEEQLNRKDT